MAAGQKIRSCWCLTFPPGLCKTETVINSHSLALCWRLSSALKEFRGAEIPEVMLVSVFLVTTLKEWVFFFSRCVIFSACAIELPSLLCPRFLCPLGHQRDQETCSEGTGQDSKPRSCCIQLGRAGCFSRGQVPSTKCCPTGICQSWHEGLSEELVILQPNTGGGREAAGEGGAREGL